MRQQRFNMALAYNCVEIGVLFTPPLPGGRVKNSAYGFLESHLDGATASTIFQMVKAGWSLRLGLTCPNRSPDTHVDEKTKGGPQTHMLGCVPCVCASRALGHLCQAP